MIEFRSNNPDQMKPLFLLFLFTLFVTTAQAQETASMEPVNNSYKESLSGSHPALHYRYIDASQTHDYSGNWDIDGDGKTDSIFFIGNGGAHLYFHLCLVLSSDNRTQRFTWLTFDLPIPGHVSDLKSDHEKLPIMPQFIVADFDTDGRQDIYLCFDDHYSSIPAKWKRRGVASRHLLLSYKRKKMVIRNFSSVLPLHVPQ